MYNHCLDKRSDSMKNAQFKVEDISGDILSKDSISPIEKTKPNIFSAKTMWTLFFVWR